TGSNDTYTITVDTGTGDGNVTLNLIDNDSIRNTINGQPGAPLNGINVAGFNDGGSPGGVNQTYVIDKTPPTVTIDQMAGQADPPNQSPIHFTIIFTDNFSPVTIVGFTATDVTLSGAAATGAMATLTAVSNSVFDLSVAVTTNGTLTATIPA